MVVIFNEFNELFMIVIIKIQVKCVNICNNILVQTLKIILRIDITAEVRKKRHRKLKIFNQSNMKLLCIIMYQQTQS